ncbi:chemotaxis protein CheR [Burkholderiaceae bacterium DAT-1]|nr:chemotaxis protein CheR [Burkholderiaceae bacterium DAT-1]
MMQSEFDLTDRAFSEIRQKIYARAGINLDARKKPMVYSRLARRLRQLGLDTFEAYLGLLEDPNDEEWQSFINALTTNLTSFFRESHHFEALHELAGQWMKTRKSVRVWCSAASSGEEPYSIAMTLVEALGYHPGIHILASDLDTQMLAFGQAGVYPVDRLERMAPERKRRFFLRGRGAQEGMACVRPELRQLIEFQQINLLDRQWALSGKFDAIFCRNVMIYFDKQTQANLLKRFAPYMHGDGRLFVGHSENLAHVSDVWHPCGRTIYRLDAPYA